MYIPQTDKKKICDVVIYVAETETVCSDLNCVYLIQITTCVPKSTLFYVKEKCIVRERMTYNFICGLRTILLFN